MPNLQINEHTGRREGEDSKDLKLNTIHIMRVTEDCNASVKLLNRAKKEVKTQWLNIFISFLKYF